MREPGLLRPKGRPSRSRTDAAGPQPPSPAAPAPAKPGLGIRLAPAIFLLFWSAGFPFAKIVLADAEPFTALALRYLIVLALMLAAAAVVRPPMPASAGQWTHMITSSALLQVGYFGFCWYAFWIGVPSGTVALVLSLQPLLVFVLSPQLTGESVGVRQWIGLLLGLAGAGSVILARMQIEATAPLELLLVLGALASITASSLYEKRFVRPCHPVAVSLIQHLVGVAGTTWLAVAFESCQIRWTVEFAVAMAWFVICNSVIAVSLLLMMIQRGEAARVSALFFLVPPTAALMSWAMLGETVPLLAWPGMALAGLGIALATRPPARSQAAEKTRPAPPPPPLLASPRLAARRLPRR